MKILNWRNNLITILLLRSKQLVYQSKKLLFQNHYHAQREKLREVKVKMGKFFTN